MVQCSQCGSELLYRDGLRYLANGSTVQRWLCRNCGFRFSIAEQHSVPEFKINENIILQCVKKLDPRPNLAQLPGTHPSFAAKKTLNDSSFPFCKDVSSHGSPQESTAGKGINAFAFTSVNTEYASGKKAKNLAATETKTVAGETGKTQQGAKGKILEFAWHLKKNGLAVSTIKRYIQSCNTLISLGANIFDPEDVKGIIAKQKWLEGTKFNYATFYETFSKFLGIKYDKPHYSHTHKLPFIPTEEELDLLIHGTSKKISVALQIIKETAMRIGEVTKLKWIDIDKERNIIRLNDAEKHSNNRMFKVSTELIQRIYMIPKKSEFIFSKSIQSTSSNFFMQRKRLALEYSNPRLLEISFHTIRHWKATIEYHRTKDILYVKNMLGHVSLDNTLIYITLEQTLYGTSDNQEFHVKIAENLDDACKLLEVGFEFVTDMEGKKLFRKRK
jgi:integrase